MSGKRIGLFGGTFDPIHNGHLLAAEQAREQAGLEEIWFLPAHIPPHKQRRDIATNGHRLRMVELAVMDHPFYKVCAIELERPGPSYTYDTICQLQAKYPEHHFSFIIGGDMVDILPKWHRFDELVERVRFIGLDRPGAQVDQEQMSAYVTFVEMPRWDLSSSLIRDKVNAGRSIRYLVPPAVEHYIKEHRLYESLG